MNTKNTIEITPGMNLGIQSPEETVMEERITESKLRSIIRECLVNLFENIDEKAKSKAQQRFMGMVHAVQKGELDADEVGSSVAKAAKTMKKKDVKDFAETKHKGLPNHVDESCDGKHPYCGEKKDMEDAEKSSPDKPMDFNKKQKGISINENDLISLIKESVQEELVDVLSKYTRGEATAEDANKAIMNLANSSNMKLNERNNRPFYDYAQEYKDKHGKKLPDETLKSAAKKNDERFHNRKK